jgi:hypothetical protein
MIKSQGGIDVAIAGGHRTAVAAPRTLTKPRRGRRGRERRTGFVVERRGDPDVEAAAGGKRHVIPHMRRGE